MEFQKWKFVPPKRVSSEEDDLGGESQPELQGAGTGDDQGGGEGHGHGQIEEVFRKKP